jgi:DUF1680 family protein
MALFWFAITCGASFAAAVSREPLPYVVPPKMQDALETVSPGSVQMEGWLGNRVQENALERLAKVDLEPLLAGFRKKPGSHPWIGEHIGKWMHAATLAWAYTGDEALRRKLDFAATELIKAQEPDGYLGTYVPEKRFGLYEGADWDVWSHKYCLLGLLSYHQYTGNEPALAAARRAGDLLVRTFGPARKSILSAGTHLGMAATSVLEPMVLLYRSTGDARYLEFCRYLVSSWSDPKGPRIIESLRDTRQVNRTANGKAYEMLSNLVGLCELARATGERRFLETAVIAWEDMVANRLYLTGSASEGEHFKGDHFLPNEPAANVAETCVTTTWIQLNSQLLRLTGQARYGNELERSFYNHLAAAQRPDGQQWCYFTALEGTKPYGPGINCCVSSGPRGMALAPQQTYLVKRGTNGTADTLLVDLAEASRATIQLDGKEVTIQERLGRTGADQGTICLAFSTAGPARFGLALRQASWAEDVTVTLPDGGSVPLKNEAGWLSVPARAWNAADQVAFSLKVKAGRVIGTYGNAGKAALTWGPFVLAYDERQNPGAEKAAEVRLATAGGQPEVELVETKPALKFRAFVLPANSTNGHPAIFVPFADAGGDGGIYRVWLTTGDGAK